MSKDHKHKPLSSEELIQLLNKQHKAEAFNVDDFEHEALEGFTAYVDPLKAEALLEEVNKAISQKVGDTDEKGTRKSRIMWFSAAASIVVIFFITIFFVKQSGQDASRNLAINEPKNEQLKSAEEKPVESAVNVTDENNNQGAKLTEMSTKDITPEQKAFEKQAPVLSEQSVAENAPAFGGASIDLNDETKSEELKNNNDKVAVQNEMVFADKLAANKKEQLAREGSELDKGYSIVQNKNVSTISTSASTDDTKEWSKKVDSDSKSRDSQFKPKTKAETAKPSSAPAAAIGNEAAYYPGSELAIKEFVLTYLKSKQPNMIIAGRFNVKATVLTNGTLKVNLIIQTLKENCNCTEKIKEALHAMPKWNAAIVNGKAIISETEFVIEF